MSQKSKKNKSNIVVIGNSKKFIRIIRSIYKDSYIKIYSWRSISNIDFQKENKFKNPKLILICGYDYASQWYSFNKYYSSNISMPIKFVKFLANYRTNILYIDTIDKIINNKIKNNSYTFSRYEFAKKELSFKLKKFNKIKILQVAPIKNKNKILIHGGFITKTLFSILIFLGLIKTINQKKLKKEITLKLRSKKQNISKKLRPFFLQIPRPLFLDRAVRYLFD